MENTEMEVRKRGRPPKEKAEEVKPEMKPNGEKIKVKCMCPCGWVISDAQTGLRRVMNNETIELDPHDGGQLHTIIQVLRTINNPRVNEVEYMDKGTRKHNIRKKFEIVSGLDSLPEVIQKTRMSKMEYTLEEREAIMSLAPDFPPLKRKEKTVVVIK